MARDNYQGEPWSAARRYLVLVKKHRDLAIADRHVTPQQLATLATTGETGELVGGEMTYRLRQLRAEIEETYAAAHEELAFLGIEGLAALDGAHGQHRECAAERYDSAAFNVAVARLTELLDATSAEEKSTARPKPLTRQEVARILLDRVKSGRPFESFSDCAYQINRRGGRQTSRTTVTAAIDGNPQLSVWAKRGAPVAQDPQAMRLIAKAAEPYPAPDRQAYLKFVAELSPEEQADLAAVSSESEPQKLREVAAKSRKTAEKRDF